MNPGSLPPVEVLPPRPRGRRGHAATAFRRRVVLLACLGLALSLASPLVASPGTGAVASASVTAITSASMAATTAVISATDEPSAEHPYSDPVWSPLRTSASVSCVRTNCRNPNGNSYHGYWAIDFIGNLGDPLFAAGAGIFHVGAIDNACRTTATAGTWVWIDHGAGRTTQYSHLNQVMAVDGQLVTPATQIGTMGHSGYKCDGPNYLHMEYHVRGMTGPKVAPGVMLACTGNGRVSMPSSLGPYSGWNDVPINPNHGPMYLRGPSTPSATSDCIRAASWTSTPTRPMVTGRRGSSSATIGWGPVPAGVGNTIVTIDQWHPSLGRYGNPVYRTVSGTASSTTFTGLLNGRPYRLRATTHNGSGYSAWSAYVKVVPVAAPSTPRAPRSLSTTLNSIRYSWWLPAANGTPITKFVVARRCVVGGSWRAWAKTNLAPSLLHYNWTGMSRGRTCQVMVQAASSAGYSHWSTVSRATTRR